MQQSKLIQLLQTFEKEDFSVFRDFLASPYFNRKEGLLALYDQLCQWAPEFAEDRVDEGLLFEAAFPGRDPDKKLLSYEWSDLLRLAEEYVAHRRFRSQPAEAYLYRLEEMNARGLEPHYRYYHARAQQQIREQGVRDSDQFYQEFRLAEIENQHFYRQGERRFDDRVQVAADALDRFYLARKLRFFCELIGRQRLFKQGYRLEFEEQISQMVHLPTFREEPVIQIYYHIWQMLTGRRSVESYQKVRHLFEVHFESLSALDRQDILSHALNFCIGQIRVQADKTFFMEEAIRQYRFGIDTGLLLQQGQLSPWHFKNIIKLAFNLKRFDWAETFIQQYSRMLPPESRENALYYNLAEMHYFQGDYKSAMDNLNRLVFTDVHYQLNARTLLLKIFYVLEEEEPLLSNLASFLVYLKRNNKEIAPELGKTYQHFCHLLHKILRRNPKQYEKLQEAIRSTSPLTDREWLMEVLEKEMSATR